VGCRHYAAVKTEPAANRSIAIVGIDYVPHYTISVKTLQERFSVNAPISHLKPKIAGFYDLEEILSDALPAYKGSLWPDSSSGIA
jgi:hypothetical protein